MLTMKCPSRTLHFLVVNLFLACPNSGMKRKMMAVSRHANQQEREQFSKKQTGRGLSGRKANRESSKFCQPFDSRMKQRTASVLTFSVELSPISARPAVEVASGRPFQTRITCRSAGIGIRSRGSSYTVRRKLEERSLGFKR